MYCKYIFSTPNSHELQQRAPEVFYRADIKLIAPEQFGAAEVYEDDRHPVLRHPGAVGRPPRSGAGQNGLW